MFRNPISLQRFKSMTTNTRMFSTIDMKKGSIDDAAKKLINKINGCISRSFTKKRLTQNKRNNTEVNVDKFKADLFNNKDENMEDFGKAKMWKLKKKYCPKFKDPSPAMLDTKGNLVTDTKAVVELAFEAHIKRLEPNKIKTNLIQYEKDVSDLCLLRLKETAKKKLKHWTMFDLDNALKKLKNDKSMDADGYVNEIFKTEVLGIDLKIGLLNLMNRIKETQTIPKQMCKVNITSVYKSKQKNSFENYRGIFRLPVLRSILDKLTYSDNYDKIDDNLTDGSFGSRKTKGCRDNMFIVYSVINSVLSGGYKPVVLEAIDNVKCFDKLWMEAVMNSLYDCGLTDQTLNILYNESDKASVAVKFGNVVSNNRADVSRVVMQGSVWASYMCTVLQDTMNKAMLSDKELVYNYKDDKDIEVGIIGFVDDSLAISECGYKSIAKNAASNAFVDYSRQEKHADKTVSIHIGDSKICSENCPDLVIDEEVMDNRDKTKYLGNIIANKNSIKHTIESRRAKGWGKVAEIESILEEIQLGNNKILAGIYLLNSCLIPAMLFCSETWAPINENQLKRLEDVDHAFKRSLLNTSSKTPLVMLQLETGTLDVRFQVMKKRIMYWRHILNVDKNEILYKIYRKQVTTYTKGDFVQILKKDLEMLKIPFDEELVRNLDKDTFKKLVTKAVDSAALAAYNNEKLSKSTIANLVHNKLKLQPYLDDPKVTTLQKHIIFKLRARTFEVKNNFKYKQAGADLLGPAPESEMVTIFCSQNIYIYMKKSKYIIFF